MATRKPAARKKAKDRTVYFLNGPNANLYGHTAGAVYGTETFEDLGKRCMRKAKDLGLTLSFRQSNYEGELIGWIQDGIRKADGIVINGAGLTYTSVALLDALLSFPKPIVEVHMSNIYRREPFRHHSFISQAATGIVAGLGADGYELALEAIKRLLDRAEAK